MTLRRGRAGPFLASAQLRAQPCLQPSRSEPWPELSCTMLSAMSQTPCSFSSRVSSSLRRCTRIRDDAIACVHACCRPHAACMRTEAPREVAADQLGLPFSSWQQCSPNSSSTISSKCRSSASLHQRSKTSNIIRCCDECARVVLRRKSSTEVNRSWE